MLSPSILRAISVTGIATGITATVMVSVFPLEAVTVITEVPVLFSMAVTRPVSLTVAISGLEEA